MKNLLPEVEDKQGLMPALVFRTSFQRTDFKESDISAGKRSNSYVCTILLLPYGKSIQVIEPISLKQKLVEVLYKLINDYQV